MAFWKRFPQPRTQVPDLAPILQSWAQSKDLHEWSPGASDQNILSAEEKIGRPLPAALRALYEISDGLGILGGNVNLWPLFPPDDSSLALVSSAIILGECEIPAEVLLFGDDGSDALFGVWLPAGSSETAPHPVIELGELPSPAMAVAGTNLCRFLKGRTAFYLMVEEGPSKALECLGVPLELRSDDPDDEVFRLINEWADPDLPDSLPDPYERPVGVEALRRQYGSS